NGIASAPDQAKYLDLRECNGSLFVDLRKAGHQQGKEDWQSKKQDQRNAGEQRSQPGKQKPTPLMQFFGGAGCQKGYQNDGQTLNHQDGEDLRDGGPSIKRIGFRASTKVGDDVPLHCK